MQAAFACTRLAKRLQNKKKERKIIRLISFSSKTLQKVLKVGVICSNLRFYNFGLKTSKY